MDEINLRLYPTVQVTYRLKTKSCAWPDLSFGLALPGLLLYRADQVRAWAGWVCTGQRALLHPYRPTISYISHIRVGCEVCDFFISPDVQEVETHNLKIDAGLLSALIEF
jgi:hypothetical protein